ncbi:MAG: PLP-dependent lyase/thiolase [Candidatus Nanopelagicales bacterium]
MSGGPETGRGLATALECSACGFRLPDDAPLALSCPAARPGDDVDHLLLRVMGPQAASVTEGEADDDPNPFVRWRSRFHAYYRARAAGWSDERYVDLVRRLDAAVAAVDGGGFRVTPFARSDALSDALGFSPTAGVWVKDETGNVSGSHKARHLFGTLLELEVEAALGAEDADRAPQLAIASCGNAALAAAVVARAAKRPLRVFIPPDADPVVVARLDALGAQCRVCPREPGVPGDPTYLALLDAVAEGAVPFTCQGNLNGLAIEGGETLGWELAGAVSGPGGPERLDHVVVQVGGGALLSSVARGLRTDLADPPAIHAVQPASVHPLARAFERVRARVALGEPPDEVLRDAATHRSSFMWPWEREPHSVAHGILDDETYDWRACVEAMLATGGGPLVVSEQLLGRAHDLAHATTGIDADHTGTAGLAGLLDLLDFRAVRPDDTVAVLFTGATRRPQPTHLTSGAH